MKRAGMRGEEGDNRSSPGYISWGILPFFLLGSYKFGIFLHVLRLHL
jgi:hypothetical protein